MKKTVGADPRAAWELFSRTGRIDAYLIYRAAQMEERRKGETPDGC